MRYLWLATVCLLSCATPASRPHPAPAGSEVVDPASGGLPPLAGAWLSPEQATCGDAELHALWQRWVLDGGEESARDIDLTVHRRGERARIEWVAEGLADDSVARLRVRYEALRTPAGWHVVGCSREALRCHRGEPQGGRCP